MIPKLKILPPTLRDKKRYIAFEIVSQRILGREDVISLLLEASQDLYGASGTGKFELWVVRLWKCDTGDLKNPASKVNAEHKMKGILRCRREEVDSVRAIIPTITNFRGKRVVFHTLGISGTIKSGIKNFIKL
jgi:ribonuclease P/MRP protein subunit POP5